MTDANGVPFVLNTQRQTDLEAIAAYFEEQARHETWPVEIVLALARVKYPDRAPFKVSVKEDDGSTTWLDANDDDVLAYMMDVYDKDGNQLYPPRPRGRTGGK